MTGLFMDGLTFCKGSVFPYVLPWIEKLLLSLCQRSDLL